MKMELLLIVIVFGSHLSRFVKYKNRPLTKTSLKQHNMKKSATSVKQNCSVGTDAAECCTLLRGIKINGWKVWRSEANYKPGLLALDEMPPRV